MSVWMNKTGTDKYKVSWRGAWTTVEGERRRPEGSKTVRSRAAAIELQAIVQRSLDTKGWYEHVGRPEERVANLEEAAVAWIKFKFARGIASGTGGVLASALNNFFGTVRKIRRISKEDGVPASVLTRDTFTCALQAWQQQGLGDARRYDLARIAFELWRWTFDDVVERDGKEERVWPGVPRPPQDPSHVLPPPPIRRAPPPAPTLAEEDAVLRRAVATGDRQLALILAGMRLTGLRVGQVEGWRAGDFDVATATLKVRVGKSRKEKVEQRSIPVVPELITLLGDRIGKKVPRTAWVFPAPKSEGPRRVKSADVRELWEAATVAEEARRETWAPEDRKGRPDHAFRAGFLAALKRNGVDAEIRHALVGHSGSTTEERSYAGADEVLESMRHAVVAHITPIDWVGPTGGNVVRMKEGEAS